MKNIKKRKTIILFISFFVLISFAQQVSADVNLVLESNITNQIIWRTAPYCNVFGYGQDWINIPSKINDGITNVPAFGGGSWLNNWWGFRTYADWSTPATVNKIEVVFRGIAQPGSNQMEAWIYRDATGWVKVGGVDMYALYGNNMSNWQTYTFNSGASWNNVKQIYIWTYGAFALFNGCGLGYVSEIRVWGPPVAPTVTTDSSSNTDTTATLNGSITHTGWENASERGFEWGTVSGVYSSNWTSLGSYGTGAFSRGIAGLAPATTYYFRVKAKNSAGWAYGPELSFTTNAPPVGLPTVVTNAANNITDNSATLNGSITNTGGENASERGFEWGTVSGVYPSNWTSVGSYGIGAFSRGIASLATSTTYYFRAKAKNSAGWAYGPELSFTTDAPPIGSPTVVTNAANNITDTTATLNGSITNTGGENAIERGFEWGTSSGVYPSNWTSLGSYGTGAFSRGIASLAPSTTYYFRAKAKNSAGWGYGAEIFFTTNASAVLYQDIGLRVQTPSGIVSIAAEMSVDDSPLRIAKEGTVYGIALVNPGDPDDSGVRIQTASGLKALRKL